MKELILEATIENIPRVTEFVNGQLEAAGCNLKAQRLIDIAIDELFSNIAYYAYAPQTGLVTVRTEVQQEPHRITISFIDSGTPFNPLMHEDPSSGLPAKERKAGGFGIAIVKRSMDDVRYEYAEGCNRTEITKIFPTR